MIGETDLKQVLLTGRGEGRAAGQALQRWLPPARGKQGYPLLPVGSVSFVRPVWMQFHFSLTPTYSIAVFLSPPPPQPFLSPDTPRMCRDAAAGDGLSHGPSLPTRHA